MKEITLLFIGLISIMCVSALDDCEDGKYFATWSDPPECMPCGACKNEDYCDKVHRICPNGCEKWFVPDDTCWHYLQNYGYSVSLEHLTGGPYLSKQTHNSVTVFFDQKQEMKDNEFKDNYVYRVQYAKEKDHFLDDIDLIPIAFDIRLEKKVYLDSPNTLYRFRIVLYRVFEDDFDLLSFSAVSTIKTLCSAPVRPPTVKIDMLSLTSVRIKWPAPLPASGCDSYDYGQLVIFTDSTNGTNPADVYYIDTQSQSDMIINDLTTGETYLVRLQSRNNEGMHTHGEHTQFSLTEANLREIKEKGTTEDRLIIVALCIACVAILLGLVNSLVILLIQKNKSSPTLKTPDKCSTGPAHIEVKPAKYEHLERPSSVHHYTTCH